MNTRDQTREREGTGAVGLFCHFAFWFGVVFATPVFVAAHNREDIVLSVPTFAAWAALACVLASLASWALARLAGPRAEQWIARVVLAAAIVFAAQGNIVHDRFDYGAFNGERVDFRAYGWRFWLEWLAWLAALPAGAWLLSRLRAIPAWLPALPVASFALLLAPLFSSGDVQPEAAKADEAIDPEVFAFSSVANLVHLLPDGLQGDIVAEVLAGDPELAAHFKGFTLFTNHVSTNQGTVPSMYSMLTGKPFDLRGGFRYADVMPDLVVNAYPQALADAGFRLDFVPISSFICPKQADSCIPRPFNDMKARGLYRHHSDDVRYSIRLIADLSLFRLVPMFLKERVYDDGEWFFADTTLDGSSPWPDPVIREWTERLHVIDDRPVYKWHHYIGTHIPAKWDENCARLDEPAKERAAYVAQARCVLGSLARFLDKLDEAGIYDQTAIVVSGDHGHNVAPADATGDPMNTALTPGLHGSGRPALLVKRIDDREPLVFARQPTSVLDIQPTALSLAGLAPGAPSVFDIEADAERNRPYRIYSTTEFYTGNPIPYVEYRVDGPARDVGRLGVPDMFETAPVPGGYDPLNRPNGKGFVLGARLRKSTGNNQSSWLTGRQLAFLVSLPEPVADRDIVISLHVPEWFGEQGFSARVNGGPEWRSPPIRFGDEFWQTVRVPAPAAQQRDGPDFVSVVFDRLETPPNVDDWKTAALVQSITIEEHQ